MLDNMKFNKTFLFAKEKTINRNDDKELLKNLKNKYKKYREDWNNQPKNCIKKNLLGFEFAFIKTIYLFCINTMIFVYNEKHNS